MEVLITVLDGFTFCEECGKNYADLNSIPAPEASVASEDEHRIRCDGCKMRLDDEYVGFP